jgi:hypothetical protein
MRLATPRIGSIRPVFKLRLLSNRLSSHVVDSPYGTIEKNTPV